MRIFSGIQPTGAKHLGNYAGGFRQYAETQEQGEAFFCIVDLHSISVEYDPEDLRERTLDLFAMLIATGLDPDRSTIFAQSHVTAHAEANWLLSSVTSFGELGRMTQFKEKSESQEFVSAGLFTYPVLQAGDILLYQTDIVPVGIDQRQHIELTRDVAERFNSRYGETFTLPRGVYPEVGAKIMDLQEPEKKMSTTGGTEQGTVYILDSPDEIRRKFKVAVTDSGREILHAEDKPGVVEPHRDHDRVDRRADHGDPGPVRRAGLRGVQGRGRGVRHRAPRAVPDALPARSAATPASSNGCLRRVPRKPPRPRAPRSRRCTSAWDSSASARGRRRRVAPRSRPSSARATPPARARRGRAPRTGRGAAAAPGGRRPRTCA